MNTTVKYLSDARVELTITVDKTELEAAQQVALMKLSKGVKAPGFRAGKVPTSVAVKYVDQNKLMEQTLDDALSKAVAEAFITENLQVLARPEVAIKKYVPKDELEFTAEVDIVPKIILGDYKNLKVSVEKTTVTAEDVNEIIEKMRTSTAEKKEVKRAAKMGDEVTIDFIGKKDDVAFEGGTAKDYSLELGSNSFIPGFEEGIVGLKTGDNKVLKLSFPDTYHVAELAGADVAFDTTLKKVEEKVLPALDDAFAKTAGNKDVSTLKELKEDIKRELKTQKEREANEKHKDALVARLVEITEVTAPQSLVNDQLQSIEQDMTQNLMYQNITLEQYLAAQGFSDKEDWQKKEVHPAAEKRVKAGLVLSELSKELGVQSSSAELQEFTERYKVQYANNPEMVKRFDEPEVQRDLNNRLLTEKTVDQLVDLNKK